MHYLIAGSGEPLVLLHGCPQSSYEWRRIMPGLAERFTVVAPDLRGLGDSERPVSGYGLDDLAGDIFELTRALGFERINLAGHDHGTSVGYVLAYFHPQLVKRFMVLDGFPNVATIDPELNFQLSRKLWHIFFQGGDADLAERLILSNLELYLRHFVASIRHSGNPSAIAADDIAEYVRVYSAPGAVRALLQIYSAIFDKNMALTKSCTAKLRMPILALGGEMGVGSMIAPIWSQVGEIVESRIVPGCGHWMAEEQPDFILREALRFFGHG